MSWVEDPEFATDRPFGPQTLPYGVVDAGDGPRVAVRVGDNALPLAPLRDELGGLADLVSGTSLDPLLAATRVEWSELRARLTELVSGTSRPSGAELLPLADVRALLPFTVGDYVDFYCSRHHAENVGRIMRPDTEPLLPNWTHLPVGYHGRSGTVVVSGTDVVRPHGQRRGSPLPQFGPSGRLDVEAEVGFVCGGPVARRVPTSNAPEHIFGVVMVNDWSARDIQGWEYQPLGPFLGKSFATSVSAWVTPLDALAVARVPVPDPGHPRLDYLVEDSPWGLDVDIAIEWNGTVVSRPNFSVMSYSCAQQLAHMTVNGATVRPGDLFASGTVSGPEVEQRGCFLELSWGGREKINLTDGVTRTFLEDGDTVVITATAPGESGSVVGIAEVAGTVLPADGGLTVAARPMRPISTPSRHQGAAPGRESSLTLDRGLALLQAVADADSEAPTISDLATAIGASRAAVYRLLVPLQDRGLVRRDGSKVRLGLGLLRLAAKVTPQLRLAALPALRELAESVGATAHLTVADGEEAQAIAVIEPSWTTYHVAYRVGTRHSLGRGAAGKAIGLRDETPGWIATSGELQSGASGIAAPVRGVPGLRASVGVITFHELDGDVVGPQVVAAATAVAETLR